MTKANDKMANDSTNKGYESLFENHKEALGEEFLNEAKEIMEAQVTIEVSQRVQKLEEEFDTRLEERVQELNEEKEQKIDTRMKSFIKQWLEEHRVSLEQGAKAQKLEDLFLEMKDLLSSFNIDFSDEKIDLAEEKQGQISRLNEKISELEEENMRLHETNLAKETLQIVQELSEGLTDSQKDVFELAVEDIVVEDVETFRQKVESIRRLAGGSSQTQNNPLQESRTKRLDEDFMNFNETPSRKQNPVKDDLLESIYGTYAKKKS